MTTELALDIGRCEVRDLVANLSRDNGLQFFEATGDPAILDQVYRLRVRAWRSNADLPEDFEEWRDDHDAESRHWVAAHNDQIVAAARLSVSNELGDLPDHERFIGVVENLTSPPFAVLSRLVVEESHRGRHIPKVLDELRMSTGAEKGPLIGV